MTYVIVLTITVIITLIFKRYYICLFERLAQISLAWFNVDIGDISDPGWRFVPVIVRLIIIVLLAIFSNVAVFASFVIGSFIGDQIKVTPIDPDNFLEDNLPHSAD